MPARNSIKAYEENGFYHIYNRGVEKRLIFQDEQDYAVFLSYLKTYLLPKDEKQLRNSLANPNLNYKERDKILKLLRLNNFAGDIKLIAYSLMPNHFHFLLKQKSANAVDHFMNSLATRYTMFFNKKYKRVGSLYQAVYKAVLVESDQQLLYLTSYIHRNPLPERLIPKEEILSVLYSQPSSLPEYLGERQTNWICPEEILIFFSKIDRALSYKSFVVQEEDFSIIKDLGIDS
jgi:putative transposase